MYICPKCKSTDITSTDSFRKNRKICLCNKCKHIWKQEELTIKFDKDGTPMIELDALNPFGQYYLSNYPIFSFFKIFFGVDSEK